MSALSARKQVELKEKLAGFKRELDTWLGLANQKSSPLRLHRSQILGVTTPFAELVKVFGKSIPKPLPEKLTDEPEFLQQALEVEFQILVAHGVWAFFREKFAQRLEPGFSGFLDVADELAWACYEPALQVAQFPRREPPLVFLNGFESPFMIGRDRAYASGELAEQVQGQPEFKELVEHLPVAIVGLPWVQPGHLPDVLAVAHEVGHVVEEEGRLADELDDAILAAVGRDKAPAWLRWRGEIFADLWACAAVGPAFVSALCDFLGADPLRGGRARNPQGPYPPPDLRIGLNLEALRLAGFLPEKDPLQSIVAAWPVDMGLRENQARKVVRALLTTGFRRLGGRSVHQLLGPFGPREFRLAAGAFAKLREKSMNLGTRSVRVVFAGVRQGYDEDPERWHHLGLNSQVVERCARPVKDGGLIPGGYRAAPGKPDKTTDPAAAMLATLQRWSKQRSQAAPG